MGHRVFAFAILAVIAAVGCANAAPPEAEKSKPSAIKQAAASATAPAATSGTIPTAATTTEPAAVEPKAEASRYYIDFRASQDGAVGHTYIAYGRLGGNGRPATAQYADYHPAGGFAGYVAGFVVPIAPVMVPTKETLSSKVVDSYRVTLSANNYGKLTKLIARIRASGRSWTAFGYNCNDFLADAARALGLQAPATNITPYQFLPALRAMNEPGRSRSPAGVAPATIAVAH